jgi:hypothetical protein
VSNGIPIQPTRPTPDMPIELSLHRESSDDTIVLTTSSGAGPQDPAWYMAGGGPPGNPDSTSTSAIRRTSHSKVGSKPLANSDNTGNKCVRGEGGEYSGFSSPDALTPSERTESTMKKNRSVSQFRATSPSRTTRQWSALSSVVLCAILFLCFIPVTHADGPAFDEPRLFGTGSDGTRSVAVGDVNGDGALDLVTGNQCGHKGCTEFGEQNVVYLNDGAGSFFPEAAHTIGPALDYTYDVAVGDLNGDGALDVVVGNFREQNGVYLNDGTGSFPYTSAYTRTVGTGADDTMSVLWGIWMVTALSTSSWGTIRAQTLST